MELNNHPVETLLKVFRQLPPRDLKTAVLVSRGSQSVEMV